MTDNAIVGMLCAFCVIAGIQLGGFLQREAVGRQCQLIGAFTVSAEAYSCAPIPVLPK